MAKAKDQTQASKAIIHQKQIKATSWSTMRSLFSFKHHQNPKQQPKQQLQTQTQKQQQKQKQKQKLREQGPEDSVKKCKKMRCSGSLCSNTKVMHKPETSNSPETLKKNRANTMENHNTNNSSSSSSQSSSNRPMKVPLRELNINSVNGVSSLTVDSSSSKEPAGGTSGSFKGKPFRRFYGCYECRMVVDPVLGIIRDPSLRNTICSCPDCGEIFMNPENLELHQSVRHAVSELGPEDTSKNIVEIIFQSSWLKKQTPICKIERILKVRNRQSTISKFEEYRDAIKAKATKLPKKNPRCVADGNELLRFHCTTVTCQLGLRGATNLCNSSPSCHVCGIIKNGFTDKGEGKNGILTTATSGRAHDSWEAQDDGRVSAWEGKRAMLVCRVIAGRVKKCGGGSGGEEYDSVAGEVGVYSNLDELYVFDPKAILPCFVVIYGL